MPLGLQKDFQSQLSRMKYSYNQFESVIAQKIFLVACIIL